MSEGQEERFDRSVRPVSSQRASNQKIDITQPWVCPRMVALDRVLTIYG